MDTGGTGSGLRRLRIAHFQSAVDDSGSTMNQCSSMASESSVAASTCLATSKPLVWGIAAWAQRTAASAVAAVTATGNSRLTDLRAK